MEKTFKSVTDKEVIKNFEFKVMDLDISCDEIQTLAKIGDNMPSYTDFLKSELESLNSIANIEGGYTLLDAIADSENIYVQDSIFHVGSEIAKYFNNTSRIALFLCTAGTEITNRINELSAQGDLIGAYLLDILGSVMVENAMDKIQENLKMDLSSNGLQITNRYSPGYCDWKVTGQKSLFSFLPDYFCKVSLNESCLMEPAKTVSGIIGIGKKVCFQKHVCQNCSSFNCMYRNKKRV